MFVRHRHFRGIVIATGLLLVGAGRPVKDDARSRSAAVLWDISHFPSLTAADRLALIEELLSPSVSSHVTSGASRYRHLLTCRYVDVAFSTGLHDTVLRFMDGSPEPFCDDIQERRLQADQIVFDGSFSVETQPVSRDPRASRVAALLLTGREDAARRLFDASPVVPRARIALDCKRGARDRHSPECSWTQDRLLDWIVLDYVLNQPDADPYDLLEVIAADRDQWYRLRSYGWLELLGVYVSEPGYRRLVTEAVAGWSPDSEVDRNELSDHRAVLNGRFGRRFRDRSRALQRDIDAATARVKAAYPHVAAARPSVRRRRPAMRFRERVLPQTIRLARGGNVIALPKYDDELGQLPEGHEAVRLERSGQSAIAITTSPYDEYWFHLSRDGGKTWVRRLYSGLMSHAPYVVAESSRLPLLDGDMLTVEVAPITAMGDDQWRRDGLYLEIPLAALSQDSDGDGVPDLAEEWLLLDRRNPDTDGDGLRDGVASMPNVSRIASKTSADEALEAVLHRMAPLGAGDRGFVLWNTPWQGGTVGLVRTEQRWIAEERR